MLEPSSIDNRFNVALIPSLFMGVLTNIYIAVVMYIVDSGILIVSPSISAVLFVFFYFLLKNGKMSPKAIFLCLSAIVSAEVTIHTAFLGWGCGFYYYIFLLPLVFLLNSNWKFWMNILFNGLIIVLAGILYLTFANQPGYLNVSDKIIDGLNFINLGGTGFIIVIIMVYFSRTINKKDDELIELNNELEIQYGEVSAQHQHKKVLMKEIHHRVKNNLQIISSLISLQSRTLQDEHSANVLDESRRRVEAIALIHQKLYQDDKITHVNFKSYLEELIDIQQKLNPSVQCNLLSDEVIIYLDTAVPLGLVASEMISNSFKHAFEDVDQPELYIKLKQLGEFDYSLTIEDNGIGLPAGFELKNDQSLGFEIIDALTTQINARLEYKNNPGASFKILFQETVKME